MAECLSVPARGIARTGAAVGIGAVATGVAVDTAEEAGVTDVAGMAAVVTDAVAMDTATPEAVGAVSMAEVGSMVAADTAEAASTVVVDTAVVDTAVVDTAVVDTAVDTGKALRVGSGSTAGSTVLPAVFLWFCLTPHTFRSPAQSPAGTRHKTSDAV